MSVHDRRSLMYPIITSALGYYVPLTISSMYATNIKDLNNITPSNNWSRNKYINICEALATVFLPR